MMKSRWIVPLLPWLLPVAMMHAQPRDEGQRYKLAQGYEEGGDLKNASRVYKELYDRDPQSNVYYEGVYRTYMGLLLYPELLPIVEERARRFGSDVELRSQYADILYRNHRRDDAEREWHAAIALRPGDEFTYAVVAQSQIDNRLYDLAAETYRIARASLNAPGVFSGQLAQVYGMLGRYAEASNEYLTLLGRDGASLDAVMGLMGSFTTNPKGADAAIAATLERLAARPDYQPYLDLLAWLYTERGNDAGAFDATKQLDALRGGRGTAIYAFADRALREGRYDAAITAFEYFQKTYGKDNPLYGNAMVGYAGALAGRYRAGSGRSRGDAESLVERYGSIAEQNDGSPAAADALMQMARLQAEELDAPDDAIATIARLRAKYPSFAGLREASILQGDLYLRAGDAGRADALYAEVAAGGPDDDRYAELGALRRGELAFYAGKFTEADAIFGTLSGNAASEVANDALGYHFLLQENIGKNDSALAHYAAGMLLLVQHRWSDAIGEMERVVALDREESLADDALFAKARAQESLDDPSAAVATLLGVVERYSDGTVADRALFHAAEIAEGALGDKGKGAELYARLLAEYPTSTYVARARERARALRGGS